MLALSLFFSLISIVYGACNPSNITCWPTNEEINRFTHSLTATLLIPTSNEYSKYCTPKNLLITTRPYFIVVIESSVNIKQDIIKSIIFTKEHDLELTIFSTGHSYTGRSSGIYNYSLQINFKNYKRVSFNTNNDLNETIMTATTGNTLDDVYSIINSTFPYKLFAGGQCPTVGIGGYSLGGGHSPLSSYLGLAIDTIYSFELITANTSHIMCYKNGTYFIDDDRWSNNSDLFWALRGGGGGTFGIILNISYYLYDLQNGLTSLVILYPYYYNNTLIAKDIYNNFMIHLATFSENVNGYALSEIFPPSQPLLTMYILYLGTMEQAKTELFVLTDYMIECQLNGGYKYEYYSTYYQWQINNHFPGDFYTVFFSALYSYNNITNDEIHYIDKINSFSIEASNIFNISLKGSFVFTNTMLNGGGPNSNIGFNDTSITDGFRESRIYAAAGTQFLNSNIVDNVTIFMDKYAEIFENISLGAYFNEDRYNNPNWIDQYWDNTHYNTLINIKQTWDPKPFLFTCHHCVGDGD